MIILRTSGVTRIGGGVDQEFVLITSTIPVEKCLPECDIFYRNLRPVIVHNTLRVRKTSICEERGRFGGQNVF